MTHEFKPHAEAIVRWLSAGKPLARYCRKAGCPSVSTVQRWRVEHEDFNAAFLEARDIGLDEIIERLRRTARGKPARLGGESTGDVQRDKLIVDTDLKLAAKWDPRRYGDKVQTEHTGEVSINWPLAKPKIEA